MAEAGSFKYFVRDLGMWVGAGEAVVLIFFGLG